MCVCLHMCERACVCSLELEFQVTVNCHTQRVGSTLLSFAREESSPPLVISPVPRRLSLACGTLSTYLLICLVFVPAPILWTPWRLCWSCLLFIPSTMEWLFKKSQADFVDGSSLNRCVKNSEGHTSVRWVIYWLLSFTFVRVKLTPWP